jgi:hypothetical protein
MSGQGVEGKGGGGLVPVLAASSYLARGQAQGPHPTAPQPLVPTQSRPLSCKNDLCQPQWSPLPYIDLITRFLRML